MNLGVLTQWVSPELVSRVLAECGRADRVANALPLEFMVYYVLALALFSQDSYEDVMDNLVSGIPVLAQDVPNKSSIFAARRRLGAGVMEAVFRAVAGQVAGEAVPGAWWRGHLVCAIDGFVLDMPDSVANRGYFGGPTVLRDGLVGEAGYPQARVVTLIEAGTRAVRDAAIGGYGVGERELAGRLVASSGPGMIVVMDRGFPGWELVGAFERQGTAVLLRGTSQIARQVERVLPDGTYLSTLWQRSKRGRGEPVWVRVIEYRVEGGERIRLLTNLLDPREAPAGELAALYAQRWESEGSNRQLKTYQHGREAVLRSPIPDLVLQEIWAHLTVNHAVSRLTGLIAGERGKDPDGISFTKALKEVRRTVIRQSVNTVAKAVRYALDMADDLRRYTRQVVPGRSALRALKRATRHFDARPRGSRGQPVTTRTPPKTITLTPIPNN